MPSQAALQTEALTDTATSGGDGHADGAAKMACREANPKPRAVGGESEAGDTDQGHVPYERPSMALP